MLQVKQAAKSLIGASIPRSGHHYLQRILSLYFGHDLYYCEFYSQKNCCKTVPCNRGGEHRVIYQKSHDREFTLTTGEADSLYIVQYRHPVPEALSDRELDLRDAIGRRSINYRLTREYYGWWLASKAVYYRNFHDKWLVSRLSNAAYMDYAALAEDPATLIAPVIHWATGDVDTAKLAQAIAQASLTRAAAQNVEAAVFKPRIVANSPHFDPDLLGPFEAFVIAHCPEYGFSRELSGSYDDHWIFGLILAQDPRAPLPDGESDHLDAAARRAPSHPEILLRLAKRHLDLGETGPAIGLLDEALSRNPYFGPGYRLLAQVCKSTGHSLPSSATTSSAMFACADSPGALVEVAAALLAEGKPVNAATVLSAAVVLAPEDHRANQLLAKTLTTLGRREQAKGYARRAAELKPNDKKTIRLLAKLGAGSS